jgi:wyosine [tRNA(Phe)-imidazoG37] synthetase (radical SAM superfamily)
MGLTEWDVETGGNDMGRLRSGIIYGPLVSGRLGRSLGVNLLPVTGKVCSFDRVYCELGPTAFRDVRLTPLSNATTIGRPDVREALCLFDALILKLDAGNADGLAIINRPAPGVDLENIVADLRELREELTDLIIQAMVLRTTVPDDPRSIAGGTAFEIWLSALAEIRPHRVQIYTLHRAGSMPDLLSMSGAQLTPIGRQVVQRIGCAVDVCG